MAGQTQNDATGMRGFKPRIPEHIGFLRQFCFVRRAATTWFLRKTYLNLKEFK